MRTRTLRGAGPDLPQYLAAPACERRPLTMATAAVVMLRVIVVSRLTQGACAEEIARSGVKG